MERRREEGGEMERVKGRKTERLNGPDITNFTAMIFFHLMQTCILLPFSAFMIYISLIHLVLLVFPTEQYS